MMKYFIWFALGFAVATTGITGSLSLVTQGVDKLKEYAPVVENKVDEMKKYVTDNTK